MIELRKIRDPARLKDYPFYAAAFGQSHLLAGRPEEAVKHFEKALQFARSRPESDFFELQVRACRLRGKEES